MDGEEETDVFRHYLGGMRNHIRELALFVAPSINSYKRYATESWAPTSISWGRDNRTCGFRIVGHGQSRRAECRIPGADVPYLGYAALLAAGLDGIENEIDPGPELKGNAYEEAEAEPFPSTLREAVDLWESSEFAKRTFGEPVWALPQLRAHRAAPVRRGRDRLRAPPHVRARLSLAYSGVMRRPVIGICAAIESAQWAAWEIVVNLSPRTYSLAVQRAGGLALVLPPTTSRPSRGRAARPARRPDPRRRIRHRPGELWRAAASGDPGQLAERDRFEIGLGTRALGGTCPCSGSAAGWRC